jgi:hypothetical protein
VSTSNLSSPDRHLASSQQEEDVQAHLNNIMSMNQASLAGGAEFGQQQVSVIFVLRKHII